MISINEGQLGVDQFRRQLSCLLPCAVYAVLDGRNDAIAEGAPPLAFSEFDSIDAAEQKFLDLLDTIKQAPLRLLDLLVHERMERLSEQGDRSGPALVVLEFVLHPLGRNPLGRRN
jgi:hypothetical protein